MKNLSVDELSLIVSFLPINEMIKCRRVNSRWKHSVHSDQTFWKNLFINYYEINQFFNSDDDGLLNSCSCWLNKLFGILGKIPKKQIDSKDEVFNPNSLECVKSYECLFSRVYPYDYCTTNMVVRDEERASFKFNEKISETSNIEVLNHFLIVIIYDALTISGYTPNLLVDKIMVVLRDGVTSIEKTIPLLTFLSCFLNVDTYRNNCLKIANKLFSVNECYYVTAGLNMESYTASLHLGEMISPNVTFIDKGGLSDPFSEYNLSLCEGQVILSYFEAGGGWIDSTYISLQVNAQDRSIVDVKRLSERQFY